jgi:hypothetical protein
MTHPSHPSWLDHPNSSTQFMEETVLFGRVLLKIMLQFNPQTGIQ